MKKLIWCLLIVGTVIMMYTVGNMLMQDMSNKCNNISIMMEQKIDQLLEPLKNLIS